MNSLTRQLANHIKRTVTGPMWHGPALNEVLEGVTPEMAAARPFAGAHSIWELVLHVTVWADVARARLRGERIVDPLPAEDWPPVGDPTATAWTSAIERMRESYRGLADDVKQLDDSRLAEKDHRPRLHGFQPPSRRDRTRDVSRRTNSDFEENCQSVECGRTPFRCVPSGTP